MDTVVMEFLKCVLQNIASIKEGRDPCELIVSGSYPKLSKLGWWGQGECVCVRDDSESVDG